MMFAWMFVIQSRCNGRTIWVNLRIDIVRDLQKYIDYFHMGRYHVGKLRVEPSSKHKCSHLLIGSDRNPIL